MSALRLVLILSVTTLFFICEQNCDTRVLSRYSSDASEGLHNQKISLKQDDLSKDKNGNRVKTTTSKPTTRLSYTIPPTHKIKETYSTIYFEKDNILETFNEEVRPDKMLALRVVLILSVTTSFFIGEQNCDTRVLSRISSYENERFHNQTISLKQDDLSEAELIIEGIILNIIQLDANYAYNETIIYVADKNGNRVQYFIEYIHHPKFAHLSPSALKSAAG